MFWQILNLIYFLFIFLILCIISIALPRIVKSDKNKPFYIYIGFYVINSIILNYVFSFNPVKTIFLNLILLLFSHFVGSKFRLMGLTGQISSGKSTVGKYLEKKYNAAIIDIDKLNREVLEREDVKKEIRKKFGDEVYDAEGELDRSKMRQIIFSDINKKRELEFITHSRVFKTLMIRILKEKILYRNKYVIIENALLLRFNLFKYICYPILSICTSQKAEILARVMSRDNCDRISAEKILASQMSAEEFAKQSDYVIFNDEGLDKLYGEVDIFINKISN